MQSSSATRQARVRAASVRRFLAVVVPALLVLLADVGSKQWAEQTLGDRLSVSLAGDALRLTLGHNTGIAFGLFANGGTVLIVFVSLAVCAALIWAAIALSSRDLSPAVLPPVGLIAGGAIANLADRVPDGRVTDFIDAGLGTLRWPAFNIADSAIVIGIVFLLLSTYLGSRKQPATADSVATYGS